ncbi:MAG: type IV pilin protein [Stenotrophobium sp.]
MCAKKTPRSRGFSLIELVIAVAIAGILAAIAIPSYQESVARTRRAQAQTAVLGLAHALERWFTNNNSYADTADENGAPKLFPAEVPASGIAFYKLSLTVAGDGSDYSISASPLDGGPQAQDKCGSFTYNASGAQGISGARSGIDVADCWR